MKQRYSRKNLRLKSKRSKKVMKKVMKKGGSGVDISQIDDQLTQLFSARAVQADNETEESYNNQWLTQIIPAAKKIIEDNKQLLLDKNLYDEYVTHMNDMETNIKSGSMDE
jgi:hypothetical protein